MSYDNSIKKYSFFTEHWRYLLNDNMIQFRVAYKFVRSDDTSPVMTLQLLCFQHFERYKILNKQQKNK